MYAILQKSLKQRRLSEKLRLLRSTGIDVPLYFEEGDIKIDHSTCRGVECKLCIKYCPTNSLYWRDGRVGIIEELCIWCTACVLSCIVDGCIRVRRKRGDSAVESFSTPPEVQSLLAIVGNRLRVSTTIRRVEKSPFLKRLSEVSGLDLSSHKLSRSGDEGSTKQGSSERLQ